MILLSSPPCARYFPSWVTHTRESCLLSTWQNWCPSGWQHARTLCMGERTSKCDGIQRVLQDGQTTSKTCAKLWETVYSLLSDGHTTDTICDPTVSDRANNKFASVAVLDAPSSCRLIEFYHRKMNMPDSTPRLAFSLTNGFDHLSVRVPPSNASVRSPACNHISVR